MKPLAALALVAIAHGQPARDPAAWGSNHVGRPVPEFVQGDECLFCHRNDIGQSWQKNAHGVTVRQIEDAPELAALLASQPGLSGVEYFLGSRNKVRFLKKDGYGRFAMLNTQAVLGMDRKASEWIAVDKPTWDRNRFADGCAGCHATGIDAKTRAFSAFGLDCYTCHGSVNLEHSNDTSLIWLSKKRRGDAQAVTSICAQCHLRGGRSRSTGLPYPNNFLAGDNLFQDYEAAFAKADDTPLNPGDRHVYRNVRDVVLNGSETTCLACHRIHANNSQPHRRVLTTPACLDCHYAGGSKRNVKAYKVASPLCEY
jgi:hypothetical protein